MKKIILVVVIMLIGELQLAFSQQTIYDTIVHDSLERAYILYVPASYDSSTATSLIFNFHGYTSSSLEQMNYGDFRPIADSTGIIIVHPMGTKDNTGTTHWNVGWGGSTVDDVGFTEALLDTLTAQYNIDSLRVYSTGMSNGGYMSFLLACQLSNRIAAIASVTGSMSPDMMNKCDPQHPTGILQFHGTNDATVPYNGSAGWSTSISSVLDYWENYNNCDPAIVLDVENKSATDGSTVEHYLYTNGDSCVNVEHYKITNGGHTWPGTAFGGVGTNYDIDASEIIWQFFKKYDLVNGRSECDTTTAPPDTTGLLEKEYLPLSVYPNPAKEYVTVQSSMNSLKEGQYVVSDYLGRQVLKGKIKSGEKIDISGLNKGVYVLEVYDRRGKVHKPFSLIKK